MKYLQIVLLLTFLHDHLQAQETTRIIETDTSIIKISYFKTLGKISEECFKKKNLTHEIWYFPADTTRVHLDFYYIDNSQNKCVGLFKSYYESGKLKFIVNEDSSSWTPGDTSEYPNYSILNLMKAKGDSIIKSIYGAEFLKNNVKFNMGASNYFDKTYSEPSFTIGWLRDDTKNKYKATEFNIRYDIHYDNQIYKEAIQIIIDKNGQLLSNHLWNENWTIYNRGLEHFSNISPHTFNLTNVQATKLTRQYGLKENDSSKVWSDLRWEETKDSSSNIFNGHFRIYVFETISPKTNKTKRKKKFHRDNIERYNVWVFNPWTKELVQKKTMHRSYGTEPGIMTIGPIEDD